MEKYIITTDLDKSEKKQGFVAELIDLRHESDGGPVAIAWFKDRAEADKVQRAFRALQTLSKF
jgi:hypothetical protein